MMSSLSLICCLSFWTIGAVSPEPCNFLSLLTSSASLVLSFCRFLYWQRFTAALLMATSHSDVSVEIFSCRSCSDLYPWSNLSTDSCTMHICFILSDSSSSIIAVSRMLVVVVVTFEVSMGSSSSMLMMIGGSAAVALAIFGHSCAVVLAKGVGLAIPVTADVPAGLVATTGFPVCSVSGPF